MGCDVYEPLERAGWRRLSVSSNGSNGLRHPPATPTPSVSELTFSILERIEWAATDDDPNQCFTGPDFQYPRTDRMGCDKYDFLPSLPRTTLSVSSNGSNGLRLRRM